MKEPDPLLGTGKDRQFTIPTASGPMELRGLPEFVSVKAGGYFFLPSRSALRHLLDLVVFRASRAEHQSIYRPRTGGLEARTAKAT